MRRTHMRVSARSSGVVPISAGFGCSSSISSQIATVFAKTLENVERWMDKAEAYAKDRGFEVDVLAQSRLAPDQYSFVKQVQSACDQAKYAAAYLSGGKAPSHPDDEQTFSDLRQRIQKCVSYVRSVPEKDFAGADQQKVAPAWLGGR